MFVMPEETVIHRPSMGFSAVTMKDWNRYCSTFMGRDARMMRA